MRQRFVLAALSLSLSAPACSGGEPAGPASDAVQGLPAPNEDAGRDGAAPSPSSEAGAPALDGGAAEGSGAPGLPCEVSALLGKYCVTCHGATPLTGVPVSLVGYAALTAPLPGNGALSTAEGALRAMEAGRMPPAGAAPSSAELAAFAAWVSAGAPETACATGGAVDPFATASICTSGSTWRDGEGPKMRPGEACVRCHAAAEEEDAPSFAVGGTVYPTGHEPDRCEGVKDVIVELTDANGVVHRYETNSAGNFSNHEEAAVAFPYTARLITPGGLTRSMIAAQMSGDCNGCHTETGAQGAPGRIVMPL